MHDERLVLAGRRHLHFIHQSRPPGHALDPGLGGQVVDDPGHPAGGGMEEPHRSLGEEAAFGTGDTQAVSQVGAGGFDGQRQQVKMRPDARGQGSTSAPLEQPLP